MTLEERDDWINDCMDNTRYPWGSKQHTRKVIRALLMLIYQLL